MSIIEAKLSSIYAAAHEDLPAQAADFARHAELLVGVIGPAAAQTGAAGADDLARGITKLGDELFDRLCIMAKTLNDSATALDMIADDYRATDDAAVEWISRHQKWVGELPHPHDRPELPAIPRRTDGTAS